MELWVAEDRGESHTGSSFRPRISWANLQPSKQEEWCSSCVDWPSTSTAVRLALGSQEENFHWLRCIQISSAASCSGSFRLVRWKAPGSMSVPHALIGQITKRTFSDFATILQWCICQLLHKNSKVLDRRSLGVFFSGACRAYCKKKCQLMGGDIYTPNRYIVTTEILICYPCRITYIPEVSRNLWVDLPTVSTNRYTSQKVKLKHLDSMPLKVFPNRNWDWFCDSSLAEKASPS